MVMKPKVLGPAIQFHNLTVHMFFPKTHADLWQFLWLYVWMDGSTRAPIHGYVTEDGNFIEERRINFIVHKPELFSTRKQELKSWQINNLNY